MWARIVVPIRESGYGNTGPCDKPALGQQGHDLSVIGIVKVRVAMV